MTRSQKQSIAPASMKANDGKCRRRPTTTTSRSQCGDRIEVGMKHGGCFVLHIDHLLARMQRLNTYEAKTNAMTRIGSNLSQLLPLPFSCE